MTDLFTLIAAERRTTADLVEALTEEQSSTPSLCNGWTVRDVAAHLTMPLTVGLPKMFLGIARHRGDFNRYAQEWAMSTARSQSTASLASTLRDRADSRFTPPGLDAHAPLTDIVVHTLDMRVPLGMPGDGPAPEASNRILDFLMTKMATRGFLPKDRLPGLSFRSTDTGWSAGSGPAIDGPSTALMLAICGRTAALGDLRGEGVDELRRRLSS